MSGEPEPLSEDEDDDSEMESEEHEESLCDWITKSIHEEMKDSGKYIMMAKLAEEKHPDKGYDAILRDIAEEENVHLRHLQEILHDIKKNG